MAANEPRADGDRQVEDLPPPDPKTPVRDSGAFIFQGSMFELGLVGLALLLGWFGLRDPDQSLIRFTFQEVLAPALLWGVLGTLPLLVYLYIVEQIPWGLFREIANVTESSIRPLFATASFTDLVLIAALAGLSEELLFRWSIQGGLSAWIEGPTGIWIGLVVASLLFGACHFLNWAYAIVTFFVGLYFGWLMIWTGTWLAPAISHGLFDLIALCVITGRLPGIGDSGNENKENVE
jgi:membrane protease YdiL (CAAX protease family)